MPSCWNRYKVVFFCFARIPENSRYQIKYNWVSKYVELLGMCQVSGQVSTYCNGFPTKCIICDTFPEDLESEKVELLRVLGWLNLNKLIYVVPGTKQKVFA